MKNNVYVLKDMVLEKVKFLFHAANDKALNRVIDSALLAEGDNPFKADPLDSQVLLVGYFDDETGVIEGLPAPVLAIQISQRVTELEHLRVTAIAKENAYKEAAEKIKKGLLDDPDFIKAVAAKESKSNA